MTDLVVATPVFLDLTFVGLEPERPRDTRLAVLLGPDDGEPVGLEHHPGDGTKRGVVVDDQDGQLPAVGAHRADRLTDGHPSGGG